MDKWIVCLKHGTKYSVEYVNILYSMAMRHNTSAIKFACITENPTGMHPDIVHIPLPHHKLTGWWFKPWVFSNEFPLTGDIMFMDLDLVIIDNMDALWEFSPVSFCIIRDFVRVFNPAHNKFNSSVFRFRSGEYRRLWDKIVKDLTLIQQYRGDQDYITDEITDNFSFWPDEWIQSYKWEIRNRTDLIHVGNTKMFRTVVNVPTDAKILVFHGDPKPEFVADPVVVNNWKL